MTSITSSKVQKERILLPLVFILLFYSGTVMALQAMFPVLRPLYPQTFFAGAAILLGAFYVLGGEARIYFERTQIVYLLYCVVATVGLYSVTAPWLVDQGMEYVSNMWKHLVFLSVLIAFAQSRRAVTFAGTWVLVTVALFVLHSFKAILAGYSGASGRFDNYVGQISNADYVGIFVAIFVVIFLQVATKVQGRKMRLAWFALSLISLVIMIQTHTRAAILVLGAVALYWALINSGTVRDAFKKCLVLGVLAGALLILGSFSSSDEGSYFDRMMTITKYGTEEADFNTGSRLHMWKQGIEIGLDNPLLGVGSGATAPHLDLTFQGARLKDKGSNAEGFSMHQTFIQIFAERGLTGLVLFCLMLFYAYKDMKLTAVYAKNNGDERLLLLANVGRLYLIGFCVGGLFITIDQDWTLFAVLALSVSLKRAIAEKDRKDNTGQIVFKYASSAQPATGARK